MPRKAQNKSKTDKGKGKGKGKGKSKNETTKKSQPAEKPKFKFKCQHCGICCETETIHVTIPDLERWMNDRTIYRVMHLVKFIEQDGKPTIILKKDDDGICNLYHRDNKKCTIYESRPMSCRSYPLGFNGADYFIKNVECKGLGKGPMSKEDLEVIRSAAFDEYIAARQLDHVLPVIYGLIFNKLIEDSQALMEKLGDENETAAGTEAETKTKAEEKKTDNNDD